MTVTVPGETCWRTAPAPRTAFLIDNHAYYTALHEALNSARHSILILGWAFDPRTRLAPDGFEAPDDPDEIGRILIGLAKTRPELDVRLLIWKSLLGVNGSQDFLRHRAQSSFARTPVKFRLDNSVPFGACHHQKIVVIDNRLAFCGGGDMVTNRWDCSSHLHNDPRRILPEQSHHPARHEVMMMVDGPPAEILGDLFRERWREATGEIMAASVRPDSDPWPSRVLPNIFDSDVAIARTQPGWKGRTTVDEIRKLTLACIEDAKHTIYLENQYFTSPLIVGALAARLADRDGPEVVLISTGHAPSWFDQLTMDSARNPMIHRLRDADLFGRFCAFWPRTSYGDAIVVHSKVSIFDDRIARVGSANLNNRSGGYDTECELAVLADNEASRRGIAAFQDRLVSHFLAVSTDALVQARIAHGGLVAAIKALNQKDRLAPIITPTSNCLEEFVTSLHLGDPTCVSDSWRLRRCHWETRPAST